MQWQFQNEMGVWNNLPQSESLFLDGLLTLSRTRGVSSSGRSYDMKNHVEYITGGPPPIGKLAALPRSVGVTQQIRRTLEN